MNNARNVTGQASETFKAAMIRALVLGLILAVPAFIGAREAGKDVEFAVYAALSAVAGSALVRGLVEGLYDARRQSEGNVSPADVQSNAPAVVIPDMAVQPDGIIVDAPPAP